MKSKKNKPGHNPPPYIDASVWPNWISYWDSDEVRTKLEVAKKCRLSEPDGPGTGIIKHRGGSRSALQNADALAKERGLSAKDCLFEAYSILHKNKDGSYTDEKSARIAREVSERAEQLNQPLPGTMEPHEVDLNKIYLEVVKGIDNRSRIFGAGELADSFRSDSSTATSQVHSQQASDDRMSQMEERLQSLTTLVETQQRFIQQMMSQGTPSSQNPPPPPPP